MTELLDAGLNLDKRQRAMLKEMGVQVWQPLPKLAVTAAAEPTALPAVKASKAEPNSKPIAISIGAVSDETSAATGSFGTKIQSFQAVKSTQDTENQPASAWRVGAVRTLYAETAVPQTGRWLVLLECPASALQGDFNPLDGDAGKLLDNMLRAAKLHTAEAALLAPLVKGQGVGGHLSHALSDTLVSANADVVVVMGRLAAQALLQSDEPLAKLRGQVHTPHNGQNNNPPNTPTIVTLDPAYLLRNPLDKAKAWDDLCLARSAIKRS